MIAKLESLTEMSQIRFRKIDLQKKNLPVGENKKLGKEIAFELLIFEKMVFQLENKRKSARLTISKFCLLFHVENMVTLFHGRIWFKTIEVGEVGFLLLLFAD